MRAVVQRVKEAHVSVEDEIVGSIEQGLVVFLGVERGDAEEDADYLASKIVNLRIFGDGERAFSRSAVEVKGQILAVSQFTLLGDCRKGRRPSFTGAAEASRAKELYLYFVRRLQGTGVGVAAGVFQAVMEVSLINEGPVTILLDSRKKF
jgi:D-tyrosyl-tRNA(Tyr) deacylase